MLVGIIGAMVEEVEAIKQKMKVSDHLKKAQMDFYKGEVWGSEVVVVVSGVGKVNAAICTQILIDYFDVDKIINVGVAGGVDQKILPGDVVIGTSLIQHDMDTTMFGERLGQIPRMDVYDFKSDSELVQKARSAHLDPKYRLMEGVIVTGDQFISSPEKVKFLSENFGAYATEMEGASIAHTAYLNHIPFIVIRSISDNASTGASMEFKKFVPIAVENSLAIVESILSSL